MVDDFADINKRNERTTDFVKKTAWDFMFGKGSYDKDFSSKDRRDTNQLSEPTPESKSSFTDADEAKKAEDLRKQINVLQQIYGLSKNTAVVVQRQTLILEQQGDTLLDIKYEIENLAKSMLSRSIDRASGDTEKVDKEEKTDGGFDPFDFFKQKKTPQKPPKAQKPPKIKEGYKFNEKTGRYHETTSGKNRMVKAEEALEKTKAPSKTVEFLKNTGKKAATTAYDFMFGKGSAVADFGKGAEGAAGSVVKTAEPVLGAAKSALKVGGQVLGGTMRLLGAVAAPISGVLGAAEEYGESGNAARAVSAGAGNMVGTLAGAEAGGTAGAAIGGTIGAFFGGVGAVPGAFIGGALGAIGGGIAGSELGQWAGKKLYDVFGSSTPEKKDGVVKKEAETAGDVIKSPTYSESEAEDTGGDTVLARSIDAASDYVGGEYREPEVAKVTTKEQVAGVIKLTSKEMSFLVKNLKFEASSFDTTTKEVAAPPQQAPNIAPSESPPSSPPPAATGGVTAAPTGVAPAVSAPAATAATPSGRAAGGQDVVPGDTVAAGSKAAGAPAGTAGGTGGAAPAGASGGTGGAAPAGKEGVTPSAKSTAGGGGGGGSEASVRAAAQAGGITDPTELAQFMAQVSHESGGFKYLTELGKDSYFQKYEGRKDLGNVQPGDGLKFKGRGYIQLTGRANYAKYGKMIGVDIENNPELAATPEVAGKLAVAYWNDRVKKRVKDFKDTTAVTKIINGGTNGLQSRVALFEKYQKTAGEGSTQVASNQAGAPGAGDSGKGATSVAANQQTGGQLAQKSMDVDTTGKSAKDTSQKTADVSMDAGAGSRKLHEKAPVVSQDDFGKLISSHFNVAT